MGFSHWYPGRQGVVFVKNKVIGYEGPHGENKKTNVKKGSYKVYNIVTNGDGTWYDIGAGTYVAQNNRVSYVDPSQLSATGEPLGLLSVKNLIGFGIVFFLGKVLLDSAGWIGKKVL